MVLVLALSAAALTGGTLATYWYDHRSHLVWRLTAGACTGTAALGLIGFSLASAMALNEAVIVAALMIVASPSLLLIAPGRRRALRVDVATAAGDLRSALHALDPAAITRALLWSFGAVVLWRVAARTMFTRPDGIYTGVSHNIGDLPFHLAIMSRFVESGNFPPEHPAFAGVRFTYPFMMDFISAMFVRAGASVHAVIVLSTFVLTLALAAIVYQWTFDLTRNRAAAAVAPALLLLSGGLGWWRLLDEARRGEASLWGLLAQLPHDYTITSDNQFRWGNLVTSVLVTQRGLLLGLPLALLVFQQWWQVTAPTPEDRSSRRARMAAAGIIAGLLPLIHAHSYAVVLGIGACLALISRDLRVWLPFFAGALALGLPQLWWVAHGSSVRAAAFIAWAVGWDRGDQTIVLFWLNNAGLFIPLLIGAMLWRGERPLLSRPLLLFYLPFTLCFILPNLFRLAPWIWDNIKVLIYWFVASVPIVALLLARLAQGGWWRRTAAAALFLILTAAGGLDIWRVVSGAFENRVIDGRGLRFASVVSQTTSADALVLHAPTYNHPIVLTGRRSLMGYPGHVWSHGLDYAPREAEIKRVYAGGSDAEALLLGHGVDYVVIGPPERGQLIVNEGFFARYPVVAETDGYRLHRTGHVH